MRQASKVNDFRAFSLVFRQTADRARKRPRQRLNGAGAENQAWRKSSRSKQGPEGFLGALGIRAMIARLGLGGGRVAAAEFEERAAVLDAAIRYPFAIGLIASGAQVFVIVHAVFARVDITSTIGAHAILNLHFQRKRQATIVTLPHSEFPFKRPLVLNGRLPILDNFWIDDLRPKSDYYIVG